MLLGALYEGTDLDCPEDNEELLLPVLVRVSCGYEERSVPVLVLTLLLLYEGLVLILGLL